MKKLTLCIMLLAAALFLSAGEKVLTMATTTSTENSGLLASIHPVFEKATGIKVKVIALGTGASIKCAEEGNADLILVHARSREDKFIGEGYGLKRFPVMYNDFVILGPKNDPACINGQKDAAKALAQIAAKQTIFVSRGDDSGTHIKEQSLWKASGIALEKTSKQITKKGKKRSVTALEPKGKWYLAIGQGMGNGMNFAFEKQGYTLADRGTYLAYKDKVDLEVVVEGDKRLFNPYGIIAVNPQKHPHVKKDLAEKYINWITSPEGQKLIGDFKIGGQVLFHPDARKN
ncbi:MAG: extracellular solute-binding protein [bacterium]|nr:extracellular solute-binding protein [bacterium]